MDNAWKDKLRDRFSDYSVPEPEGLWEGIEQGLAGKPRRRMPAAVWWLSGALAAAAAVALVVLLPGTGRFSLEPGRAGEEMAYVEPMDEVLVAPSVPDTTEAQVVPEAQVPAAVPASGPSAKASTPFGVVSRQTLLAEADVVKEELVLIPETPEEETVPEDTVPEETVPSSVVQSVPAQPDSRMTAVPEDVFPIEPDAPKKVRRPFSLGLYRQGGQASVEQTKGFGMVHGGDFLTRAVYNNVEMSGLMNMLATNSASTYDARHRAPVRIGVQAAWQMTEHLALVSGVNWTTLYSQFEETTASTRMVTDQDLGYLGVPLRLQASFNPWNRLWIYADAGGMMEKGLQASSTTQSFIGNHLEWQDTGAPEMGGLLWSVGASVGAEYRFNNLVGVYFAPGVEYHFENGAAVRSAYTDKPLHWTFDAGVRFHLGR